MPPCAEKLQPTRNRRANVRGFGELDGISMRFGKIAIDPQRVKTNPITDLVALDSFGALSGPRADPPCEYVVRLWDRSRCELPCSGRISPRRNITALNGKPT